MASAFVPRVNISKCYITIDIYIGAYRQWWIFGVSPRSTWYPSSNTKKYSRKNVKPLKSEYFRYFRNYPLIYSERITTNI